MGKQYGRGGQGEVTLDRLTRESLLEEGAVEQDRMTGGSHHVKISGKSVPDKSKGSGVAVSLACQGPDRSLGRLGHGHGARESYLGRVTLGHSKDFDFILSVMENHWWFLRRGVM